ncbi:MAG: cytidylate kinase family protein [Rikenellaceae bacterium]
MKKVELLRRYAVFGVALFFTALGVSVITRSYLGTSPMSSVPYVMSLNTPLSMGFYISMLNLVLISLQMLMLGRRGVVERRFDLLLQLPVSLVFSLFIDLTMWMLADYMPGVFVHKILSLVVGCAILALGVALEVVADVTMVSGEYAVQIASRRFGREFGVLKMGLDISLVIVAVGVSLLFSGRIEGVGLGTVVAALLTGPFVRLMMPLLGWVHRWLGGDVVSERKDIAVSNSVVITISREYGSGGHLIGKQIAHNLGLSFYDSELITMVARESHFSESFVSEHEQNIPNRLLYQMILQDYEVPLEKSLSSADALFVAQSKVIRRVAAEGSCVIVGRCADYILKDFPHLLNIFIHADIESKVERAVEVYGLERDDAKEHVLRVDSARAQHYQNYVGRTWGDSRNYHLTFDSSTLSQREIEKLVGRLYQQLVIQQNSSM